MSFVNDPIADLLTRIRNSLGAQHLFVDVPHSKMKEAIVKILKEHGFLAHYLVKEENKKKTMRVFLKYQTHRKPVIRCLKRVSKPSLRVFVSAKNIPSVFGSMGVPVLSTSHGIMDGKTAKEKKIGGELLCLVW